MERDCIAIVVVTYERMHLLRQCVENVLAQTSPATKEIVIWNNASSDGTRAYLDELSDPRLDVVHASANIGMNAYAHAVRRTTCPYFIELDDDVVDAPERWDATLLQSFRMLPEVGFLAATLVDDEHDTAAHMMYRVRPQTYTQNEVNGVALLEGPTGGFCTITSRELYDRVGGFRQRRDVFWSEDAAYIEDLAKLGYRATSLRDLKVRHAGGEHYARTPDAKHEFWHRYWRRVARKNAVKRALLRVPAIRRLNERYSWFRPPVEGPAGAPVAAFGRRAEERVTERHG